MTLDQKIVAVVGITEAIKQYGVPSKFCPTIAIIVGVLLNYAERPTSDSILEGIVVGATVTGSYAVAKKSGQGILGSFKSPTSGQLEADDYRGV